MKFPRLSTVAVSLALTLGAATANAELARVGPVDVPSPPGHGFPQWYQDFQGVVLDICNPTTQAQVTPCLLAPAPGDPLPVLPFVFPTNWPAEQFWYAFSASQDLVLPNGDGILVEGAIEAAFAVDRPQPQPGEQISFARIRIRFDAPVTGTYTVTHPYGVDVLDGVAGERIFFTEDIGTAQGIFTGALAGRVGPFLQPVTRDANGVETPIAPVVIDGRRFLTDGATDVQVSGSPFVNGAGQSTNYAEVCVDHPGGLDGNPGTPNDSCVRTDLFSVIGMLHEGNIPSPLAIDRATYRRDAQSSQVDVFANTTAGIGQAAPLLSFKGTAANVLDLPGVACADVPPLFPATGMAGPVPGLGNYFGQALAALPPFVTVTNSADVPATCVSARVVDEVNIVSAIYDPTAATLTVRATSSDQLTPPALTVTNLPGGLSTPMTPIGTGSDPTMSEAVIPGITVPLASVSVRSSAGGLDTEAVVATAGTAPPPPTNAAPVAVNDVPPAVIYTTAEDTVLNVTAAQGVLANDTDAEGDPLTAVRVPGAVPGTLSLNPDGSFQYTPPANFSGIVTFQYVAQQTTPNLANSAPATVQIEVLAVNDPPVAVNDVASTVAGTPVTINVLANDTDVDAGAVLTVSAINGLPIVVGQTVAVPNGTVSRNADGTVTFTSAANFSGAASFLYTVSDGTVSATATVTVTVVQGVAEAITIAQSEFRTGNVEWRINGTDTVLAGQTLNLDLIQINGTVLPIATTTVNPIDGTWTFRGTGPTPTAGARVRVTSQLAGATQTRLVTIRR